MGGLVWPVDVQSSIRVNPLAGSSSKLVLWICSEFGMLVWILVASHGDGVWMKSLWYWSLCTVGQVSFIAQRSMNDEIGLSVPAQFYRLDQICK